LYKLYKLVKIIYTRWVYKINYDLKLYVKYIEVPFFKKKNINNKFLINQLILEYFLNGIIYFFLILNWLWMNEWNKWASLTDILEYTFFDLKIFLQYINNYNIEYSNYFFCTYDELLFNLFYNLEFLENQIKIYNIYLFNSLNIFHVLFNIENIKLEHEKYFTLKKNWKNIKKVSFNYLNIDILNDFFFLSFFSFCIFEFNIAFNKYNMHYITIIFFEYWVDLIIEKNYMFYFINKKKDNINEIFKFENYNLKNLYIKIFSKNNFKIRVKYNLFLSYIDYFIFFKNFTYNYYIKNFPYFYTFSSQRKIFLKYNNPASVNRGTLSLWHYDQLFNKYLLLKNNINSDLNLFDIERVEPFFNFGNKKNKKMLNYLSNLFLKDFNFKFLYKLKNSDHFFYSINKFFDFNLIDFYNLKNRLDSYKDVMLIKSVYVYRFANSSFKNMDEFMLTIFKTPLENYIYFNELYKGFSYNIIYNIFLKFEKNFFFFNFFNNKNMLYIKNYSNFFRFFNRLFKIYIYFFKFYYFWDLIKNEESENLLKIDVFSKFYEKFEEKKFFFLVKKLRRKNFNKKWSIQKFFNIVKYNTMFYLDIYSMSILFSGWLYEIMSFSKFLSIVKIYNKIFNNFKFFDNFKYIVSFKDFFFQLMYENIEYSLCYILFFYKEIKYNMKLNYLNKKDKIFNNFIYRKYMLYTWLEYDYYDDLFIDLDRFSKGNYSLKLSKWILRYFYKKAELHEFYSESIKNKFINKNRFFL